MQAELDALGKALEAPTKPVIAIIGGAKVSTKIDLLENLVSKVDALVIGGGMANTFLHAQGIGIGKSLAEKDLAATALRIIEKAEAANCAIILPVDAVVAFHFAANARQRGEGCPWLVSRCVNCSTTRRNTTMACPPSTSTIWSRRSRSWRPLPASMRRSSSRPRAARAPMPMTSCSST